MTRYLVALGCAAALGMAAYAYADSTLVVKPSQMKAGESKTITDDGKTITVAREGNTTVVTIDNAGDTERLTITREGDRIRIGHDGDAFSTFIVKPEKFKMPEIVTPQHRTQTWFVCPKDHTMMRVPAGKSDQTFKCPVDGTTMEKRKGHGFSFFFDDHVFESERL